MFVFGDLYKLRTYRHQTVPAVTLGEESGTGGGGGCQWGISCFALYNSVLLDCFQVKYIYGLQYTLSKKEIDMV